MKETKVYVDELPESCSKCEYCTLNHKDNYGRPFCLIARMPLYNGEKVNEERGQHKDSLSDFDCQLIEIKDHDRELVKEVCEKIRKWGNKHFNYVGDGTGYDGQDYNEMIGFNNAIKKLNEFLDQIQKEVVEE